MTSKSQGEGKKNPLQHRIRKVEWLSAERGRQPVRAFLAEQTGPCFLWHSHWHEHACLLDCEIAPYLPDQSAEKGFFFVICSFKIFSWFALLWPGLSVTGAFLWGYRAQILCKAAVGLEGSLHTFPGGTPWVCSTLWGDRISLSVFSYCTVLAPAVIWADVYLVDYCHITRELESSLNQSCRLNYLPNWEL